jgi:hypothetical protein
MEWVALGGFRRLWAVLEFEWDSLELAAFVVLDYRVNIAADANTDFCRLGTQSGFELRDVCRGGSCGAFKIRTVRKEWRLYCVRPIEKPTSFDIDDVL